MHIKRTALTNSEMNLTKTMTMKNQINRKSVLIFVLFTVLILVCVASANAQTQASYNLRSLDGTNVTSENQKGKVVVFAVAASWLPLSEDQAKGIKRLAAKYALKNVEFYWVFTDSASPKSKNYASDDQLRSFAKSNSLPVNLLRDPDGVQMKRLGVSQVPAFVIFNRSGKLFGEPIEGIDPDGDSAVQLEKVVISALKEK
jgi:peroxiredoxin